MDISGTYTFDAPAAVVWAKLLDPEVLAGCLPGVGSLECVEPNSYRATLDVRVGPVRSTYAAKITLHDLQEPVSFGMTMEAVGPLGFSNGEALVTVEEHGATALVTVKGTAQVGGAVARVGQRVIGSVAQGMTDRMFACLQASVATPES